VSGFLGILLAGGDTFGVISGTATSSAPTSSAATATLNVNSDGSFNLIGSDTGTVNGSWIKPNRTGVGNSYWVRFTITSGTVTTGTTGSWLALSSNQSWTKSATNGAASVTGTLEIATDAAGANIIAACTGSVTLSYSHF